MARDKSCVSRVLQAFQTCGTLAAVVSAAAANPMNVDKVQATRFNGLVNFGKDGEPQKIIAKVNQETLADMIGTTRSRVSHFMNKFRKLGFIDYNGHLEIHSSLLNVVLHDQPHISGVNAATGKLKSKPVRKAP